MKWRPFPLFFASKAQLIAAVLQYYGTETGWFWSGVMPRGFMKALPMYVHFCFSFKRGERREKSAMNPLKVLLCMLRV